jgi:TM2 domain-containing membrane protein YozV
MRCVNHAEAEVQSYCQHCGKGLCADCVRKTPAGQILCNDCLAATGGDPSKAYWQAAASFVAPPPGTPNPAAAAVLGLIPGVGAMYNGQLFKGLIHVVIFAVLVSITHQYGVFGIFVGAWVLYQSFEAFHTAKARRDGTPIPDPFGLNEVGQWLNVSGLGTNPGGQTQPPASSVPPPGPTPGATGNWAQAEYQPPPTTPYAEPYTGNPAANPPPGAPSSGYQPPYQGPTPGPYQGAYPDPYAGQPGYQDPYAPGPIPPIPPPYNWRRREPVWAIVMIVLGVLFLLNSMGFVVHIFRFSWPILLIVLGAWLIVRRVLWMQGGPK